MLNEPTLEKLHALRLRTMAETWQSQQRDATVGALSFDERFTLIVDAEYLARDNRRLARLLKDAELRIPNACLEDVDTSAVRGVDRSMIRQLANCGWIGEHLNILVTGATGVGKSYLASALGQAACRRGLRAVSPGAPPLRRDRAGAGGQLARDDGRRAAVAILQDFEQVVAVSLRGRSEPEVVEHK